MVESNGRVYFAIREAFEWVDKDWIVGPSES